MEEIEELQRMLAEVQESRPRKLLSERNAMDILSYLKQKMEIEIVSTFDGSTFFTMDALDRQIYDTLLAHKRLHLSQLENITNVSADLIENRFDALKKKYRLITLHGQVITEEYMESVLTAIKKKMLAERFCALPTFVLAHDLDLPLVSYFINASESPQGVYLREARQIGNVLYAASFFAALKSKIAGVLAGITVPISVSKLAELVETEESLVADVISSSAAEVESGNVLPRGYFEQRKRLVQEKLQRQGYLDFEDLQSSHQIGRPKDFFTNHFAEQQVLFFEDCLLLVAEFENIVGLCAPIIRSKGLMDLADVLLFSVSTVDGELLAQKVCETLAARNLPCESDAHFLLAPTFLQSCVELVIKELPAATAEKVGELLIEKKKLDYLVDEELKAFIARRVVEVLPAAQPFTVKKQSKRSGKAKMLEALKLSVEQLIDRFEFLAQHFLLCCRNAKKAASTTPSLESVLTPGLRELKEVVEQNMLYLLIRKFGLGANPAWFIEDRNGEDLPELFAPLFKDASVAPLVLKALPRDVQEGVRRYQVESWQEVSENLTTVESADLDLDLEALLTESSSALALGNLDVCANKKREKAFGTKLEQTLRGFITDQSGAWSIDVLFRAAILREYLRVGFVWLMAPDLDTQILWHRALAAGAAKSLKQAVDEVDTLLESFAQARESAPDLDELVEQIRALLPA